MLKTNFNIPLNGSIYIEGLKDCKILTLNGSVPFNGDCRTIIRTRDIQYIRISDHLGFSMIKLDYNTQTLTNTLWQGEYPTDNLSFESLIKVN